MYQSHNRLYPSRKHDHGFHSKLSHHVTHSKDPNEELIFWGKHDYHEQLQLGHQSLSQQTAGRVPAHVSVSDEASNIGAFTSKGNKIASCCTSGKKNEILLPENISHMYYIKGILYSRW